MKITLQEYVDACDARDRAEAQRKAQEEARRKAEAEARRKAEAEAEARRKAEAEAQRKAQEEARLRNIRNSVPDSCKAPFIHDGYRYTYDEASATFSKEPDRRTPINPDPTPIKTASTKKETLEPVKQLEGSTKLSYNQVNGNFSLNEELGI